MRKNLCLASCPDAPFIAPAVVVFTAACFVLVLFDTVLLRIVVGIVVVMLVDGSSTMAY
jgi:hypothetical protein